LFTLYEQLTVTRVVCLQLSPRLSGECSPPHLYNVEAELSEGGEEIEFLGSDDDENRPQPQLDREDEYNHRGQPEQQEDDDDSVVAATPEPIVSSRGAGATPHHPHAILAATLGHRTPTTQPVRSLPLSFIFWGFQFLGHRIVELYVTHGVGTPADQKILFIGVHSFSGVLLINTGRTYIRAEECFVRAKILL
jgi:hypothetical protein